MPSPCPGIGLTWEEEDEDTAPPPRKKKAAKNSGATAGVDIFSTARGKLGQGASARDVEQWLQAQGVPRAAATAMVEKALRDGALRQGRAPELNEGRREP